LLRLEDDALLLVLLNGDWRVTP